jgi:aspartyl-tRNA(Asn)/glutamyl-tRNA(Gln) amidotransferase subunit C
MPRQKITSSQVRHVAKLARLALDEQHIHKYTGQLESILEYIAKIDQINLSAIEPMAHTLPLSNVFRDDVAAPSLPPEDVLKNAPDTNGPFFKVPKIIGNDEDSTG